MGGAVRECLQIGWLYTTFLPCATCGFGLFCSCVMFLSVAATVPTVAAHGMGLISACLVDCCMCQPARACSVLSHTVLHSSLL